MKAYLAPPSDGSTASGAATDHFVFACAVAIDVATMRRVSEAVTIADETRVVLRSIEAQLAEAGCTLRDVVKTTCYVSDEAHRMEFIYAYKEVFAPGPYPARCTFSLGIAGNCRVQVDAIAYREAGA